MSITSGEVPGELKSARVKPLLRKIVDQRLATIGQLVFYVLYPKF